MTRPGVEIISRAAPPVRGAPSDTGTWFVAGLASKGPTDRPIRVRNLGEFIATFGGRVGYSHLYDAVDAFFREGGTRAHVIRVVGPDAEVATVTLDDTDDGDSIAVDAVGPGPSTLSVAVVAGEADDTFRLIVTDGGVAVANSPDLTSPTDAVSWAAGTAHVRVRALGSEPPHTTGPTALAGGDDDRANITDSHRAAALELLGSDLGRGQVSYPGGTTAAIHAALQAHAVSHNRVAILDAPDTHDVGTLTDLQTFGEEGERSAVFGPWAIIPGLVRGTTRTVPYSAIQAGMIARADGTSGNPNEAVAGVNGISRSAIGLSQPPWTDTDREQLNEAGFNVARLVDGQVRTYGYRTLSRDPEWRSLGHARLRMAIEDRGAVIAEQFLFAQIDGRGLKLSEYGGALTGELLGFYELGALYGESSEDAFIVDVGPTVNTPDTLADDELRAVMAVRMSPFAELVRIEIVKVNITEVL